MKIIFSLLLFISTINIAHAQCFEITSIFVDACGPSEGENEMFTFDVGSDFLNTSDLTAVWPNSSNNFLSWCQDAGTAASTAALNNTILTSCGWLIEPQNDSIPAGASVLVITSTNISLIDNSFEGLADTMYIVYQCAGNTDGHFANDGSGTRDLILSSSGSCTSIDIVTYDRALLDGNDGATVLYDAAGTATYINNGCNAPVTVINPFWTFSNGGTYDGNICSNHGVVDLNTLLSSNATTGGTWSGPRVTGTNYNPSGYLGIDSVTYSVSGTCTQDTDSTIVFNVVAAPTGNTTLTQCDSALIDGIWYTSSQIVSTNAPSSTFYGCDSTTNINLIISTLLIDSNFIQACNSVEYLGTTYFNDTILRDTILGGGGSTGGACSELFISEYVEGQSNNKAIEIYNGTGATVDLSDYTLERYTNGSPTSSTSIALSGMLIDGDVYIVYNSNTNVDAVIVASGDLSTGSINHNGDDAYSLNKNGVIVDIFGNIGCDPGSEWTDLGDGTANNVLFRNANYTTGLTSTINPPCTFPSLNATNWTSLDVDDVFTTLGSHTANCSSSTPSSTCDSIYIVNIKVNKPDTVQNLNNPITICNTSDSTQLADGSYVNTAGTYYTNVGPNSNGCDSTIVSIVTTEPCDCNLNLGPDINICQGDSVTLNTGNGFDTYVWQDGITNTNTFTASSTGLYFVEVTSTGCLARDSVLVTVSNPSLTISSNATICNGDSIILNATGTSSILWSTNETTNNITVSPTSTSTYTVQGEDNSGCTTDEEQIEIIVIDTISNVILNVDPNSVINQGETVEVSVSGDNIQTYDWSPINSNTSSFSDSPTETTTYYVTLGNTPCPSILDSITIIVNQLESDSLIIPNAFTPNGDGNNDVFRVVNFDFFESYTLKIFNRWGHLIFEENAYGASWDGEFKKKDQNNDTYTYFIDAKPFSGNENIVKTGTVTIIR